MKTIVASDHAGFQLKSRILRYLSENKIEGIDLGTNDQGAVDYPDYALKVAELISTRAVERGILICGTGIGMSIAANKFKGVRAALCHNEATAEASRRHNDANVLVLGGRVLSEDMALKIVAIWLGTPFEGGRHQGRLDKITSIEKAQAEASADLGSSKE